MSQISPPIRIVLAVAALFLVAWMTVLKPKSDVVEPIAPITTGNVATGQPAESAAGKMAAKAKGAVTAANDKHNAALGETTTPSTTPATGTAAGTTGEAPAAGTQVSGELAGLPKPVVNAILHQKVVVLLFWNPKAAEDRAVRAAMRKVDRWNGRVFVKVAPIDSIARYGRIARGVDVQQSPTVVVVDRKLAATALVGYVDRQSIDQAVLDALRNSGGIYASGYLRKVNDVCASTSRALFASPDPNSAAETPGLVKREVALRTAFIADLRAVKAPARFTAFKAAAIADAVAMRDVWAQFGRQLGANPSGATIAGSAAAADKRLTPISKRFNARMDKNHVLSCGSNG